MKKIFVLAALGLGVGAVSSFGQGAIQFNSYLANASSGATVITFAQGGAKVGAGYSFDVYYSLTALSGSAGSGALPVGLLASGSGSPSSYNVSGQMLTGGLAGYFAVSGNNFTISPYTALTPVYFDVVVYQTGSTYETSAIRGQSGVFSATLATGTSPVGYAQFSSFTVAPVGVPEPTTLALAGLGGLASLVMLRRKNA